MENLDAAAVVSSRAVEGLSIRPPDPPERLVFDGFFTVHRDGRVELADGVTNDEAARALWTAVRRMAPGWLRG